MKDMYFPEFCSDCAFLYTLILRIHILYIATIQPRLNFTARHFEFHFGLVSDVRGQVHDDVHKFLGKD